MPSKRQVLDLLSRDERVELAGRHDLRVQEGRFKAQLADALDGRGLSLTELLAGVSRERLKEPCRGFNLRTASAHVLQSGRAADAQVELR
ncbi:hypothetical protein WME90_26095 [Sorangium sp. So ce375]|uniref:hypothetical protein n=1 Tax=Sorangium sp. So ce375 TaxID=3133306 RepID=UPI003F5BB8C7